MATARKTTTGRGKEEAADTPTDPSADAEKYGRREDFGAPIDAYLAKLGPDQLALCEALRALVHAEAPGITEAIKWGMPVFATDKLICYFSAKSGYVRFGFHPRIAFDDPDGRLEGTMAHVKLRRLADIDPVRFGAWVRAAVAS